MLAVGCWLLAVGCWLLAVGCWLLAVGCWLLAVLFYTQISPFVKCFTAHILILFQFFVNMFYNFFTRISKYNYG
jgi:hypothetical protein